MTDLLPCPFCGGEADYHYEPKEKVITDVSCRDLDCVGSLLCTSDVSWNTRAQSKADAVEVVTVDEYAERMLHKVVLDGQYSYCYGRDTAKEFPNGLKIVEQKKGAL